MYVTVGDMQNSQDNRNPKIINVQSTSAYRRFITSFCYSVWSVLGLFLLVILSIAMFGSGTWQENLNLATAQDIVEQESAADATAPPQQQQAPPQQPAEPTPEQLACVEEAVGEERLSELAAGAESTDPEEIMIIEQCLSEE